MVSSSFEFLRKGDIIHYRIKNIIYNPARDCFEFKLVSCLPGPPGIKARINYYHATKAGFAFAETDSLTYCLVSSGREYVEKILETITDELKETLAEVYKHGKDKRPKRISIF